MNYSNVINVMMKLLHNKNIVIEYVWSYILPTGTETKTHMFDNVAEP